MKMKRGSKYLIIAVTSAVLATAAGVFLLPAMQTRSAVLQYEFDPLWPKLPLPERVVVGQVGGMCINAQNDHVLLLNRQQLEGRALSNLDAGPVAPAVIEFDPGGNLVNGWGDPKVIDPNLHDCHVDKDNNVWILGSRSGFIQKYSSDGSQLLLQIGKSGVVDSSDGTLEGEPLNSNAAHFFLPAGIAVDPQNGDVYVADGEGESGNHRIAVMDRSGTFLRQWQLNRGEKDKDIRPVVHCIGLSNDGVVYVCDRGAGQVQMFDKMGNFKTKIVIPWTRHNKPGEAVALDFSPDANQRFLYVANQGNEQIDVIDRQTEKILTSIGSGPGHWPGQFDHAHGIAVDSRGNVYVAEVDGRRVQRFKPVQ